jgi:hypothetical protein
LLITLASDECIVLLVDSLETLSGLEAVFYIDTNTVQHDQFRVFKNTVRDGVLETVLEALPLEL